ncbi:MAG: ABC transporter substrate-binding protein [Candidatus Cloacimonetes bacterium]|nr:ABC transporter substrate-binding protein [Candidatus Cloacimonadota bacterium]
MHKIAWLALVLLLVLAGCGKPDVAASDVTEVVFWQAMGGPLGDALAELVEDFNNTHPHIRVNSINMGNYTALSQKLMASIQTGNQPAVAQSFEAWTSNMMKGNVIVPVEELIAQDSTFGAADLDDFFPVFIKSNTIDGKLVSFPFNKSVRVQYYNKDMFFQNDLDPNKPPKTWDEFRKVCRTLTKDFDGDGIPDQYGTVLRISAWQFENLLLQAGGEIMDSTNTKPLFNSAAGIEALNFMTAQLNEDKSSYLSTGYDGQKDFSASKVALYEDSSVSLAYMLLNDIDFPIGISAIPTYKTKRSIISGTNVVVFRKDDEAVQRAAWEFVKWFTEPAQTAKWSELTYYMPVRRSAFEQPALKERLENNPEIKSVYDQLEFATYEPQISEWYETRKYLEEQVIEKVIRGVVSPEKALNNAAVKIAKMIEKSDK